MSYYSHYVVADMNSSSDNPKAYVINDSENTSELCRSTYKIKYCHSEEEAQEFCDKYNAFSEPIRYYLFEDFDDECRAGYIAVGTEEAARLLAVSTANECMCELVGYTYEEALEFCDRYNDGEEFPDFIKEGTYVLEIHSNPYYDGYDNEVYYHNVREETFFTYEEALEAANDYELDSDEMLRITRDGKEVYGNSDEYTNYPTRTAAEQALYSSDKHFKVDDMDKEIARIKQEMAKPHKYNNNKEFFKGF